MSRILEVCCCCGSTIKNTKNGKYCKWYEQWICNDCFGRFEDVS